MKKFKNLNQLITEALEGDFKIVKVEDNLLNGIVQKRWEYSYTYPKNSAEIITPQAMLDFVLTSTGDGDLKKVQPVLKGLKSPQAIGISADQSQKKGLLGGKNQIGGYIYVFKNVTDSAVNSVNPEQLLVNPIKGSTNVTTFHILSSPRSGGESIQQNLGKIITAAGSAPIASSSGASGVDAKRSAAANNSAGGALSKLTVAELTVSVSSNAAGSSKNGAQTWQSLINSLFQDDSSPTVLIKRPSSHEAKAKPYNKGDDRIVLGKDSNHVILEPGTTVRGPGIPAGTEIEKKEVDSNTGSIILILNKNIESDQPKSDGVEVEFYTNTIFPGDDHPIMGVLSKFFNGQDKLGKIVTSVSNTYTPEIKTAIETILNQSGDPDYGVDASFDLDKLTKTQLVTIMTVWLVYAVNNGIIPRDELEATQFPTISKFKDTISNGAGNAISSAKQQVKTKRREIRLKQGSSLNNKEELYDVLLGAGWKFNRNNKAETDQIDNLLVNCAGDREFGASSYTEIKEQAWQIGCNPYSSGATTITIPQKIEVILVGSTIKDADGSPTIAPNTKVAAIDPSGLKLTLDKPTIAASAATSPKIVFSSAGASTSERSQFSDFNSAFELDGEGPMIYTPEFKGLHTALGILRKYLGARVEVSNGSFGFPAIPGRPASFPVVINSVPDGKYLAKMTLGNEETGQTSDGIEKKWKAKRHPSESEIQKVEKGFGWDKDLEIAIDTYRQLYYKSNP